MQAWLFSTALNTMLKTVSLTKSDKVHLALTRYNSLAKFDDVRPSSRAGKSMPEDGLAVPHNSGGCEVSLPLTASDCLWLPVVEGDPHL